MKDVKHRLPILVFAMMLLLFAQAALLHHEYDFAAHKSGETCVTCLHATPLSHGMSGTVALALPLPVIDFKLHVLAILIPAIAALAYRARGPPPITSI
jgi:hypothetical protein